jgi:serine/threonine protein kinase
MVRAIVKHGITHRDIKPQNLYRHDGSWVVGDFGLIEAPNLEALTATGRLIGPTYFIAYDVMQDPRPR